MARKYHAGELDQRIVIEHRLLTTQNTLGENTTAWATLLTRWAKAVPIRGREYFAQGEQQQTVDVMFVLRYDSGTAALTSSMRVLWRGTYYALVSPPINVDGQREWLELMTVTGVGDGR